MTRFVTLDTETTGLCRNGVVSYGHRIIEIACVDLSDGSIFHSFINPEGVEVSPAAYKIHGINQSQLSKSPTFSDIADRFIQFITGAVIIIHNAPFDISFIDQEFSLLSNPPKTKFHYIDSLILSREIFPGLDNRLYSVASRLGVKPDSKPHSALADATTLASIWEVITTRNI